MSIDVRVVSWEDYQGLLSSPDTSPATLFHHPRWLRTVRDGIGVEVAFLGLYDGGTLIGVLPGFISRKGPVGLFGSPLRGTMTPYLGWLLRKGIQLPTEEILSATYRYCRKVLKCHFVEVGFLHPPADLPASSASGWEVERPETYVIDLRIGKDALWKNLESRGRSFVRKAEKQGVTIDHEPDEAFVDEFYEMLQATLQRQRAVSPHSKSLYLAMREHLLPCGMMKAVTTKYNGRAIARSVYALDEQEIHLISTASLAEFHHLRPNNLLYWGTISWAAGAGLTDFDLGGKGHPGIDRFKQTFGPSPVAYTVVWKGTPVLALARRLFFRYWPQLQAILSRGKSIRDALVRRDRDKASSGAFGPAEEPPS